VEAVLPIDSITFRISLDDPLDPEDSLTEVGARVIREDGNAPEVIEVLHPHVWEAQGAPADPDAPPALILPGRDLIVVLSRPLLEGVAYRFELDGIRNIQGLTGGGGSVEVVGPPAPPATPVPPPTPSDSPLDAPDAGLPDSGTPDAPILDPTPGNAPGDGSAPMAPAFQAEGTPG
jgi:hypothetical protein